MKPITIPTRENTWMLTWWVPLFAVIALTVFRHMPPAGYAVVDIILFVSLVFAMWRMWQKSSITLKDDSITVQRGKKVVRILKADELDRISVTRAAIGIYVKDGGRLPKVSRGMRFRSQDDRENLFHALGQWCKAKNVQFIRA